MSRVGLNGKVARMIEDINRQEGYTVRSVIQAADQTLMDDKPLASKAAEQYLKLALMILHNMNHYGDKLEDC